MVHNGEYRLKDYHTYHKSEARIFFGVVGCEVNPERLFRSDGGHTPDGGYLEEASTGGELGTGVVRGSWVVKGVAVLPAIGFTRSDVEPRGMSLTWDRKVEQIKTMTLS